MGSFNIACSASGQVISEGDKCWAIPLIQQCTFKPVQMKFSDAEHNLFGIATSICHPDAFWKPMSGFVSGTYADYGFIEPEDTTWNRRHMVELFLALYRRAPVVFQGENTSHDLPFDIKAFIAEKAPSLQHFSTLKWFESARELVKLDFSELAAVWRYVWDVAQEHRLFCADSSGNIRPVQFGAFHHISIDHLVGITCRFKDWDNLSYEPAAFLRRELNALRERSDELLADGTLKDVSHEHRKFFIRSQFDERLRMGLSSGAFQLIRPSHQEISDLLEQHLDKGMPFEQYVECMLPILRSVYVLAAMNQLNIKLSPLVYAGQDYDNTQGSAYAKFVSGVSKEITNECNKRYDE